MVAMLQLLHHINSKSAVGLMFDGNLSNHFVVPMGVLQGDVLAPSLVSSYDYLMTSSATADDDAGVVTHPFCSPRHRDLDSANGIALFETSSSQAQIQLPRTAACST
jgi:hypothetical protein